MATRHYRAARKKVTKPVELKEKAKKEKRSYVAAAVGIGLLVFSQGLLVGFMVGRNS